MSVLKTIGNEKISSCTLDNISQFIKSKSEDMQYTTKCLAYFHHNVLQRGDYHS